MTNQANQVQTVVNYPKPGKATRFQGGTIAFRREVIDGQVRPQRIPDTRDMTTSELQEFGRQPVRVDSANTTRIPEKS